MTHTRSKPPVTIYLSPEDREEVARRANLDGRSISDYIARLVVAHIAPPKGKRNGKGKS